MKPQDPKSVIKRLKAFMAQHPEWDDPEPQLTAKQQAQQKFIDTIRHSELITRLQKFEAEWPKRKKIKS